MILFICNLWKLIIGSSIAKREIFGDQSDPNPISPKLIISLSVLVNKMSIRVKFDKILDLDLKFGVEYYWSHLHLPKCAIFNQTSSFPTNKLSTFLTNEKISLFYFFVAYKNAAKCLFWCWCWCIHAKFIVKQVILWNISWILF